MATITGSFTEIVNGSNGKGGPGAMVALVEPGGTNYVGLGKGPTTGAPGDPGKEG